MKKSVLQLVQIFSFFAGLVLFVFLLRQTGLTALVHNLKNIGWGFVLIILLSAVRNFMRAGSWYFAIEPSQRTITFWKLTNVMLAGEAIKYLTATGPLLGEPAKAAMIRRQVPLLQGFSSVFVENLIYYLTVFVFMLAGLPALIRLAETSGSVRVTAFVLMAFIALAIAITSLAIKHRWYVLARALEQLGSIAVRHRRRRRAADHRVEFEGSKGNPGRMETIASQVRVVEDNLYDFYGRRRAAFHLIFWLNMGSHLINVVEVYVILVLLELPANLLLGFLVESVTKVINLVFFFVPTRAGVYESGHALLLQSLGMTAAAGGALAIIRKLRAVVWAGYGLIIIGWTTLKKEE